MPFWGVGLLLPLILLGLAGTAAIAMMFDGIGPDDDPVTEETPDDPPLSDLASVIDEDGQSLQPEEYWSEQEGFYAVTGTGGDDIITVDATTTDPDAAFDILVRPGEGDDQITVGIGTEVTMSEYDWLQSTDAQDSDTGSDDVTVIVSEGRLDQIGQDWTGDGEQAGWVDLTDEKDSLDFEFDDDVTGNPIIDQWDDQNSDPVITTNRAWTSVSTIVV